jgi:HD-GYP domain-containing protein (c-di-GMP phosphodiesterase class II)
MASPAKQPGFGAAEQCPEICPAITLEIHQLAESLGNAIDAKDHFTRRHSEEVAVVAYILALGMGLSPTNADLIHIAGHLHDIGKIGIPDSVLQKPGPLSDREWREIKRHPVIGADIIAPVRFLRVNGVVDMVYHHHESFDGQGYPQGLAGDRIPLGARIIAVADSVSAMMQDRPYRRGHSLDEVRRDVVALAGVRYDPEVVRVFLNNSTRIAQAIHNLADAGHAAAIPAMRLSDPQNIRKGEAR